MAFQKLRDSLRRTSEALTGRLKALVKGRKIDAALWVQIPLRPAWGRGL